MTRLLSLCSTYAPGELQFKNIKAIEQPDKKKGFYTEKTVTWCDHRLQEVQRYKKQFSTRYFPKLSGKQLVFSSLLVPFLLLSPLFTPKAQANIRFRFSTTQGVSSSGFSNSDGEVEDYKVNILAQSSSNPLIGVAKKIVETNGTEVTLDFAIENFGDVTLNNLDLTDNLDTTFGAGNYSITSAPSIQVAPSQSSTVTPSNNFNGSSNTNLLDPANSELKTGETVAIRMIVKVTDTAVGGDGNGNYINNATVSGDAPNGTTVTDQSTDSIDPDVDNFEDNSNGNQNDDGGMGINDGDNNPNNNTYPTIISFVDPNQANGGFCSSPYGLVYSGSSSGIYAVHAKTGIVKALTTNALNTVNAAASDHINKLVYYSARRNVYAWDSTNNQHITITNNINSFPGTGNISSLSSGGAAFYNGSLYTGVDRGNRQFEVYKIDFVPGSQGRTIQSVTALGLNQYITDGDWGDMIISDQGVIYGSSRGTANFWSYDLNTNTFTDISESIGGSQLAKDGEGNLWAFVDGRSRVTQIQIVGNSIQEVGTGSSIGSHSSFDAAECVIGESSIGDRVWEDTNGDGIQDSSENGIENVTVDLYWDVNGNGTIDSNEPVLATQTTDADGNYDFPGLIFGDYIVKVTDTNGVLTEKQLTTPSDTIAVNLPTGIVDYNDADFGYRSASNPNVLLIKRITAINGDTSSINGDNLAGYIDETSNPYDDNDITIADPVNPGDPPKDTDKWPLPLNDTLKGAINGGKVDPGDKLEYTIYFLSTGDDEAKSVLLCDRVPSNTTFIPTAFNSEPNQATGGLNSDRGILWNYDGNIESLSNAQDGDVAQYFPPGVEPSSIYFDPNFPNKKLIDCGGDNINGAVVVNLGNLPNATAPGTPTKSYGFIRFRGKVK
ncbi:MAG: SdrD B-like domain-containing protein [Cyanobacteria bacterium P01_A01_bin.84]